MCAGFGSSGQLGQGNNSTIGNTLETMGDNLPSVDLGTGRTAMAVSLGATHSCAGLNLLLSLPQVVLSTSNYVFFAVVSPLKGTFPTFECVFLPHQICCLPCSSGKNDESRCPSKTRLASPKSVCPTSNSRTLRCSRTHFNVRMSVSPNPPLLPNVPHSSVGRRDSEVLGR